MPITNVSVSSLESYQPAIDYRKSGRVGVLSGQNFAWDASGVYSAYASRLVAALTSIGASPNLVQSLDIITQTHLAVLDKIWRLTPASPGSPTGTWLLLTTLAAKLIYSLPSDVPYDWRKWYSAYLGGKSYVCSYNLGVYEVNTGVEPPTYTRLTTATVTGFPADATPVIAICETNGRMLYMTELTLYWSAPNAPKSLIPALGGAGFQVIAERIGGKPVTMIPTANGAIIFTSTGALAVEFIGGNSVFRYFPISTRALPISAFALSRTPGDDWLIITRLGLYGLNNLTQPQPLAPMFNEFLREYLRSRPNDIGHCWYSITDNRLYVSFRSLTVAFVQTYTLDIALDRWGIFNEQHIGVFDYGISRGQLAYANSVGVVSYLLPTTDSKKNKELTPGVFVGLASDVTIGWIRAENLVPHADVVQEVQEVLVNRLQPVTTITVNFVDEEFITTAGATVVDEGLIGAGFTKFDEGSITDGYEAIDYDLQIITDLFVDGEYDSNYASIFEPTLVRKNKNSDLWVALVPTISAQLRFIATEPDQFFRINSLDMTVSYQGNIS